MITEIKSMSGVVYSIQWCSSEYPQVYTWELLRSLGYFLLQNFKVYWYTYSKTSIFKDVFLYILT